MPAVKPEILTWARETAGLSLEEAAHAIGLGSAHGKPAQERLLALEQGEAEPSRSLLRRMAQKYRRSLLVFYLDKPPEQGDRGEDFRSVSGAAPPLFDATLDALLRDIRARHSLVRSVLEDDEVQARSFVGSANMQQGTVNVGQSIIETLDFDIHHFRDQDSTAEAFAYLRSRIEEAGIFVLLIGNLGSHHTNIPADTFRGFAIADPVAPLVVVNDQDARTAWSFTVLHEVTHLWLGTTGVSGASVEARIERFCNEVAGQILLPAGEIQALEGIHALPFEETVQRISAFAQSRKISRAMVAYSLFQAHVIPEATWRTLRTRFYEDWQKSRSRRRARQRADAGGPSYYVVRRHRLGPALLSLVSRSLGEGVLTHTKAAQVLGVKPRNVEPLLRVGV